MRILILYATIEGQTRKIAEALAANVESRGHQASLMNVGEMGEFTLERPDAVILAAPIHAGRYPAAFLDMIRRERDFLNARPLALVSVTLAIRSDHADEREQAMAFPTELARETGIRPLMTHNAAGALRFSEYDFFKRWIMRQIAEKEGQKVDPKQDVEFTDWAALKDFGDEFLERALAG